LGATSAEIDRLVNAAFAPSTQATYQRGLTQFQTFRTTHGLPTTWPAPTQHVLHFAAHLSLQGRSPASVRTYIAAIASCHKLRQWPDPTANFLITKLLQGLDKSASRPDRRLPITFDRLCSLVAQLPATCYDEFEATLFRATFSLAFFAFLRISELLGGGSCARRGLQMSDVQLGVGLTVFISGSKTDQRGKGTTLYTPPATAYPLVCPVQAMHRFLAMRSSQATQLFVHQDGSPLTRRQFQAVLTKAAAALGWDTNRYTSHSFRIGAATTAAANGMSEDFIKTRGRWASAAFRTYIRPSSAACLEPCPPATQGRP